MSGTREGGRKAVLTNKAKYGDDFYNVIGAQGGKNGNTGGFAKAIPCKKKHYGYTEVHYLRNCAGRRGGTISRRPKKEEV